MTTANLRPPIIIDSADHERLFDLALLAQAREPGASALVEELSRANIFNAGPETAMAAGLSNASDFEYDGAFYRNIRLVYPGEADFAKGRLSVLSSVGAMLLGLSKGQSIDWDGPDGRRHKLTVLDVMPVAVVGAA